MSQLQYNKEKKKKTQINWNYPNIYQHLAMLHIFPAFDKKQELTTKITTQTISLSCLLIFSDTNINRANLFVHRTWLFISESSTIWMPMWEFGSTYWKQSHDCPSSNCLQSCTIRQPDQILSNRVCVVFLKTAALSSNKYDTLALLRISFIHSSIQSIN